MTNSPNTPAAGASAAPDFEAIKARQRTTWGSGDFAVIGTTLQIVGETLCEAVDLRSGSRVLDVAAGNGNCALAAARRFAEVTAIDYVPEVLEDGRRRATADRLPVTWKVADAEALPFDDGSFDAVLSSFGVMFAPNQMRAASELLRVCRPGGRVGLANWTPEGFVGRLFKVIGRWIPPPAGLHSPARWGTKAALAELFDDGVSSLSATPRTFDFRYRSPDHWIDVFRTWYGPVLKAFDALPQHDRATLHAELVALVAEFNRSGDATMVVPGEYLEVVIVRA